MDPIDRTTRWEVPVLARPFAVLQAAVVLEQQRPGQGITLIDRAKQQRWVSEVELERIFLRHRGAWGSLAMRRLLDRTGDRAHSELERLAVRLLRAAGITGFVVNYRTVLPGGRPVELDGFFATVREVLAI